MSSSFIDSQLPLIDLHRHLDGNVRLETILDLGLQYDLPLPARDLENLRPFVQVTDPQPDILAFFAKFQWQTIGMVNPEVCRRIAFENMLDAAREGIAYIELRFSPWFMAAAHKLDPTAVTEAVVEGVRAGAEETGVRANLIGILSRTYGPEMAWQELAALLTCRDAITALDLAGDEIHFPGDLFIDHFKKARDAGWHITVHAGESAGPESVWQALRELGAERIGHAVHAPADPTLIAHLCQHAIPIESNLTSNVQTSTVASYSDHPMRFFLEQDLCATINTDDPGISAIDLPFEYNIAAPRAGLTPPMIRQAQLNALQAAFLSNAEKESLLKKFKRSSEEPS
jgi:adenosine deaminase